MKKIKSFTKALSTFLSMLCLIGVIATCCFVCYRMLMPMNFLIVQPVVEVCNGA